MRLSHRMVLSSALVASALACTSSGPTMPDAPFDLAPFQRMAREGADDCADARNALYLIDQSYVAWHRESTECSDSAHVIVLFGPATTDRRCQDATTVAGPLWDCSDASLVPMFDVIRANLHSPGYGIDPPHVVERIPF